MVLFSGSQQSERPRKVQNPDLESQNKKYEIIHFCTPGMTLLLPDISLICKHFVTQEALEFTPKGGIPLKDDNQISMLK